jgi:hypothetical protein
VALGSKRKWTEREFINDIWHCDPHTKGVSAGFYIAGSSLVQSLVNTLPKTKKGKYAAVTEARKDFP